MYRHTRHLMMYGIIGLLPAAPPFQAATRQNIYIRRELCHEHSNAID